MCRTRRTEFHRAITNEYGKGNSASSEYFGDRDQLRDHANRHRAQFRFGIDKLAQPALAVGGTFRAFPIKANRWCTANPWCKLHIDGWLTLVLIAASDAGGAEARACDRVDGRSAFSAPDLPQLWRSGVGVSGGAGHA